MLLLLAIQAAAPQPAEIRTFGDWTIACDNGGRCTAAALQPAESEGYGVEYQLVRDAGPAGPVKITIAPAQASPATIVSVRVDGRRVASGRVGAQDGAVITGAEGLALARAMANGRRIKVMGPDGKVIDSRALTGSAAALRYADDRQRRAGTVTALAARGSVPATRVPAAPPLPRIVVPALPTGVAPLPPKAQLMRLGQAAECNRAERGDEPEAEAHRLDRDRTVLILSCGNGAYNFWSGIYLVERGRVRPAPFDVPTADVETTHGVMMLTMPDFDRGVLSSWHKGRGVGDCGTAADYAWDGTRFRLSREERMDECRGSLTLLPTWRAVVVRR